MDDAQDGGAISELLNAEELRERRVVGKGMERVVGKEERGTERKRVKQDGAGS